MHFLVIMTISYEHVALPLTFLQVGRSWASDTEWRALLRSRVYPIRDGHVVSRERMMVAMVECGPYHQQLSSSMYTVDGGKNGVCHMKVMTASPVEWDPQLRPIFAFFFCHPRERISLVISSHYIILWRSLDFRPIKIDILVNRVSFKQLFKFQRYLSQESKNIFHSFIP